MESECLGCGCTDNNACVTEGVPCHWLNVDTVLGVGVCSCCEDALPLLEKKQAEMQEFASDEVPGSDQSVGALIDPDLLTSHYRSKVALLGMPQATAVIMEECGFSEPHAIALLDGRMKVALEKGEYSLVDAV